MHKIVLVVVALGLLSLVLAHNESPHEIPRPKPSPGGGGSEGGGGSGGGGSGGGVSTTDSCPRPTPQNIKCMQQWACHQLIRLDLRCLLNLNGNNLLGNLVSIPGVTGGGGASGGGGGGLLGGLLGK